MPIEIETPADCGECSITELCASECGSDLCQLYHAKKMIASLQTRPLFELQKMLKKQITVLEKTIGDKDKIIKAKEEVILRLKGKDRYGE